MARKEIKVWQCECERCQHQWVPREQETLPTVCPKCKTPYWNTPKKNRKAKNFDEANILLPK